MSQKLYSPKHSSNPYIKDFDEYKELYKQSIEDPSKFFKNLAHEKVALLATKNDIDTYDDLKKSGEFNQFLMTP